MSETFSENAAAQRYELRTEGGLAWADYRRRGADLVIPHVEAEPALRGTGAAGRLMRQVADAVAADGGRITPLCAYARAWLTRNAPDLIA